MGNMTKSTLEVDGEGVGTIYWMPSDEINVFYGTAGAHYVSQNAENATTAIFSTTDIIGISEGAATNIWGLYPYNPSATCTGTAVKTTLPATQYGVPDTFDDDLFITLAHNTSTALTFFNVCGGIKFSLSRDDISKITFQGNRGELIAGDISLSFVEGHPSANVSSGQQVITLLPKTGDTFSSGENYYLVLLPVTLAGGFTMAFETNTGDVGVFCYDTSSVTISRSKFGKKANIDSFALFTPPDNQIWYTTTDGNILSGNSWQNTFSAVSHECIDGKCILTFENDIENVPESLFANRDKLVSVSIPKSVNRIQQTVFANCSSLKFIAIPHHERTTYFSIATGTFHHCTSLVYISLPEVPINGIYGGVGINNGSLRDCSSLATIVLPNTLKYIGSSVLKGCTSLSSPIIIPSSVQQIYYSAFEGCSNLPSITFLATTPPTGGDDMFKDTNDCPIYVPAGSLDAYKAASKWSVYADRIQAIP